MSERDATVSIVKVVAIAAVIGIGIAAYFGNQNVKIEAEKAEQVRQIEAQEQSFLQAQETERTEERAQFWQKLVPWGKDESEENTTGVSVGQKISEIKSEEVE